MAESEEATNQAVSETEKLYEQGFQRLLTVAAAQTVPQALEICQAAIEIFRQANEAAGDDLELRRLARQGLAAAYSQLGHQQRYARNYNGALASLTEALNLNPTSAEDYYYRAQNYLKLGNEQAARRDFTEYLRRGEDDYLRTVARQHISDLNLKSQDSATHAAHWQQEGMRLSAEAGNAVQPRGEAPPDLPRAVALYNKALDAFDKALKADPKAMLSQIGMIGALSAQAECYFQMEEYDLAIANYTRAYGIRPQAQYVFKRGEAYRAAGHREQARADFERYIKEGNDRALKAQAQKYLEEKPRPEVQV